MANMAAKSTRVVLGVILLFLGFAIGVVLGDLFFPSSAVGGRLQSVTNKSGGTIGIFVAAAIIRIWLLRSLGLALVCLVVTELTVLLLIMAMSGMGVFTWDHIQFVGWWLYTTTWNVVAVYPLGLLVGTLLDKLRTKKSAV